MVEFRNHCKQYALKYLDIQRQEFKRLGVRGDWGHPYMTLDPVFESVQIKVFGAMANKGYIYKGLKPVYWCGDCETALAEAEVEYGDKVSPSIYVKFPVKDGKGLLPEDAFIVIWTTTPWTLPANTGISLHPDYEYVLIAVNGEKYLVAKGLLEEVSQALGWENVQILQQFTGKKLELVVCSHPFSNAILWWCWASTLPPMQVPAVSTLLPATVWRTFWWAKSTAWKSSRRLTTAAALPLKLGHLKACMCTMPMMP